MKNAVIIKKVCRCPLIFNNVRTHKIDRLILVQHSVNHIKLISILSNMTTVTTLDKVCKNIGRLPLELRHAIFNCLTIDFRLEMVLQKTAHIIRTLYEAYNERILDITALQRIVNMGIRWHFFYNKGTNGLVTQSILRKMLPNIEFKQMGDIVSTQHPVFKALREIVVIPTIHGSINSTSRRFRTCLLYTSPSPRD